MSIPIARLAKRDVIPVYTGTAPLYDLWAMFTETHARTRALALADIHNGESVQYVTDGREKAHERRELLPLDVFGIIPEKPRRGEAVANVPCVRGDTDAMRERTRDADERVMFVQADRFKSCWI